MRPNIGMSAKNLENDTTLLSKLPADEMTVYIKTRKFHSNISGESFMELHKLLEGQHKHLDIKKIFELI